MGTNLKSVVTNCIRKRQIICAHQFQIRVNEICYEKTDYSLARNLNSFMRISIRFGQKFVSMIVTTNCISKRQIIHTNEFEIGGHEFVLENTEIYEIRCYTSIHP